MTSSGQQSLIDAWLPGASPSGPIADQVPGLHLIPDFVAAAEAEALIAEIDARPWSSDWKRRLQVYGAGYGDESQPAPLPPRIAALGERIRCAGLIEGAPDNAVVNEYVPGVGIAPHRDHAAFGPTVVGVSLLSWCVLDLIALDCERRVAVPLPPLGLYVIGGEARSRWKHGIAARRGDLIAGLRVPRQRRLSITWRTAR